MTFSLSAEVNFIKWQRHIQDGYIKRALAHDFEDFKLMRLIRTPHGDPGQTFALQLFASDTAVIEKFENDHKPKLDHQLFLTFGEACLCFVTVLEHL